MFDPLTYTASWGLLTSVQGPYQLARKAAGAAATPSTDLTALSFTEMTAAAATYLRLPTGTNGATNRHFSGNVANLAKCVAQGVSGSLTDRSTTPTTLAPTPRACSAGSTRPPRPALPK